MKESVTPSISIIMGVYNNQVTLRGAVDSVLAQTYSNFELIMCDDGSKDQSWVLMQELASNDGRIVILKNEKNLGHPATLNKCINHSRGEFIARMDGDDVCLPNRLEAQLNYLLANHDVGVVGSAAYLADNDMNVWGLSKTKKQPTKLDWALGSCLYHSSVMMRKALLVQCGKYNPNALFLEDYELWMRMVSLGVRIENLEIPLLKYKRSYDDFNKQKFKFRLKEVELRFRGYRAMRLPLWYYFLIFKPLIIFFIPRTILFYIQKNVITS